MHILLITIISSLGCIVNLINNGISFLCFSIFYSQAAAPEAHLLSSQTPASDAKYLVNLRRRPFSDFPSRRRASSDNQRFILEIKPSLKEERERV